MAVIRTPVTDLFKIKHPILLAGMNVAAGPELAAAVSNAGGLGVIGGLGYTPKILRQQIKTLKNDLKDKNLPFGVDLLLPQVGGNARKTNYDYTHGQLSDLIDVIIDEKTALFVCAVGVPPKEVVEKLHAAGIPVMNMVGHVKHVEKALAVGADIICAQGGEGGGHTGDIPFSLLIPGCVDACKGRVSPLTGKPVMVIAAGGIYDGRGLAAALQYGAAAVWVGTRFVASVEAGAPKAHKDTIVAAGLDDDIRTLIFTGRPLRVRKTPYIEEWEGKRREEMQQLLGSGKIPAQNDVEKDPKLFMHTRPWLMGKVSGLIREVQPAQQIVDEMVKVAAEQLTLTSGYLVTKAKL